MPDNERKEVALTTQQNCIFSSVGVGICVLSKLFNLNALYIIVFIFFSFCVLLFCFGLGLVHTFFYYCFLSLFFFVTFLFLWIQIKNCCVADITKVRSYFNRLRNRHGNTSDGPFYICINDKNVSQRDKVWKSEQKREETTKKNGIPWCCWTLILSMCALQCLCASIFIILLWSLEISKNNKEQKKAKEQHQKII